MPESQESDGSGVSSVDVLLPVRLPAPWLLEALDGLSAQTLPEWRLVLVIHGPGGSIAEEVVARLPGTFVVPVDAGVSFPDALNLGLQSCTAPLVARLDADDVPLPSRLRAQRDFMDRHPECLVLASSVELIDSEGRASGLRVLKDARAVRRKLRWKNPIAHPSVMMRRDAVLAVGGYSALARQAEDFDLWLRIAAQGAIDVTPDVLTRYRIHSQQVTKTQAITKAVRGRILESRVALAEAEHRSVVAARVRHAIWASRQIQRSGAREG